MALAETRTYSYDAIGNRTALTIADSGGTLTDTYSYPATDNRLSTIAFGNGSTRTFAYDANGNVTYDARSGVGYGYTYDDANRMASFSIDGVVQAEYKYNHLGQQTVRTLTQTGQTIHSVYGPDGNRIAEFDGASKTIIREYVWLEGEPIAVIEAGQVYYVRADHIARPVFATDASGSVV